MTKTYRCDICEKIDDDCYHVQVSDPYYIGGNCTLYHMCRECFGKTFGKGGKE